MIVPSYIFQIYPILAYLCLRINRIRNKSCPSFFGPRLGGASNGDGWQEFSSNIRRGYAWERGGRCCCPTRLHKLDVSSLSLSRADIRASPFVTRRLCNKHA